MLGWMWRSQGKSRRSTAVVMSGLDEIFHPEAARAREFIEIQHEMVSRCRGGADKPWDDGTIVIDPSDGADD
jgi:hypothetical protein